MTVAVDGQSVLTHTQEGIGRHLAQEDRLNNHAQHGTKNVGFVIN